MDTPAPLPPRSDKTDKQFGDTTMTSADSITASPLSVKFRAALESGSRPRIEDFLPGLDATEHLATQLEDPNATGVLDANSVLIELLSCELEHRWRGTLTTGEATASGQPSAPQTPDSQTINLSLNRAKHVEELAKQFPQLGPPEQIPLALIIAEYRVRQLFADRPTHDEYLTRFSHRSQEISEALSLVDRDLRTTGGTRGQLSVPWSPTSTAKPADDPKQIGRYTVERLFAKGGFGKVYLARDEQLDRLVAVKVPRDSQFVNEKAINEFLTEARLAARLNHPGIVTIFDVGREPGIGCYVVMEFLAGRPLEELIATRELTPTRLAELMADIADAVHHAHQNGLVHRDLKPANILFDANGRPRVADFGLALHASGQRLIAGEITGTPLYMAPEQTSGETHRLDGRTDLWSLGVILYRALCHKLPFAGESMRVVFRRIQTEDPVPPRELDPAIPPDMERIVLKCLSKRMSDRYATASELARELRLAASESGVRSRSTSAGESPIVPRGLRSFSARDAEFFLRLLPGPVDRSGVPESISVWKERIEHRDIDASFSVGVLYGPTGCGKSSLVRAGLLPLLSSQVAAAWIEAKPEGTEDLLLRTLYRLCPKLPAGLDLVGAVLRLREGRWLPTGQKVCVFLDQFEQWLHARKPDDESELVKALRHCDGVNVQCVLMVRDDFWLAISRFLRELEIPLLEGNNSSLIDLFDLPHATKVLGEFGRAYGRIDQPPSEEQKKFLRRAATELASDGAVIPVRLAMFAEMMKSRPWTLETLRDVGGSSGLGTRFLEETFVSSSAPPEHRLHEQGAKGVLAALMPEAGTDIKGRLRSTDELRQASGYVDEPEKFADLMRILDSELKLVTPATEPVPAPSESYYQLAHDYLVPSLRDWLTHHQRQTRAGRAALRLNELSAWWNAKPIARHLPGWFEWLNLRFSTRKRLWKPGEEKMMRAAARHHLARAAVVAVCVIASLVAASGYHSVSQQQRKSEQAASLVAQLSRADVTQVPRIVSELTPFFPWAQSDLRRLAAEGDAQSNVRLSAALALQQAEGGQTEFLRERLLDVSFEAFPVVRDALEIERGELADWLWPRFRDTNLAPSARFRAGMALASAVPHSTDWTAEEWDFLARRLVTANADQQKTVRTYLKPVGNQLIPPLRRMFGDVAERDTIREAACLALTDFAAEELELLIELIAQATPPQYAILEPVLSLAKRQGRPVLERLVEVAAEPGASATTEDVPVDEIPITQPERIARGKRRAGAAIAAIRLGAPKEAALTAFQGTDDLEPVSQFIHNGRERGVTPADLLDGLDVAQEVIPRFGLILALGEFPLDTIPTERRESLVARLNAWYANDPSAAIHAACGWLLATWRHPLPVIPPHTDVREALSEFPNEWIVQQVGEDTWNMIVHRPSRFVVGSPLNEPERTETETSGTVELPYAWMIADRELTRGQFEKFFKATERPLLPIDAWSPTGEHPMIAATWFEAVLYCRWLTQQAGFSEEDQCYPDPESPGIEKASFEDGTVFPKNWMVDVSKPGFRLPTEMEWEFACRAGTRTAYSFGSDRQLLRHYGWYVDNSSKVTHVGGELRPSIGGLFDIHGNVLEWCNDWMAEYPSAENPDPLKGLPGTVRIYRGGAWDSGDNRGRSARRDATRPSTRLADCGIRLVRTIVR